MPITLPAGFRYLQVGEFIKRGDLLNASGMGEWVSIENCVPRMIGMALPTGRVEFCRLSKTKLGNNLNIL